MSSDFCAFQDPFYNSIPMFDPFSSLSDSSIDTILQEEFNGITTSLNEAQMESLSLYQPTHFTHLQNSADFVSGIKLEDSQFQMNPYFSGSEGYGGFLQRSYSHGFQPAFSAVSDSPENSFSVGQFGGHIRRVLSTGDLPKKTTQTTKSSSISTTLVDEASFKVGKYSAEERKERIDRYRAKRSLRNFNKTIKYSCRKTLADSRPRIRGRFARNDEPVERARTFVYLNRYEDEDDHIWVEGQGGNQRGGQFFSKFGESSQFDHEFMGLNSLNY